MVGAAPVCPPEHPRSGVSMRKGHVPTRKEGISMRKRHIPIRKGGVSIRKGHVPTRKRAVSMRKRHIHICKSVVSIHKQCLLTPKHVCVLHRWMRPCRATRAGTQAPPLPASIKSFRHVIFLDFAHRRIPRRQFYDTNHARNGRGGACVPARTSAQRRFHPQRARPPPAKEPFPFINDACSHQNMFVYLPMNAPLQGDAGGHTGTAPTSLHQILPPRNLP